MWRRTSRNEANLGQADAIRKFFGQTQMRAMHGIEGPAQHAEGA